MHPAIALTIGGSDSGGGAGIQADLKTFLALQVHGCSAITCVTAQNTCGVQRVDALPPEALSAQVAAVLDDFAVGAIKTGMLFNRPLIEATAAALTGVALPTLIDPVMVSRAGSPLLEPDAVEAYRRLLFPLAELITPNLHEAALLTGMAVDSEAAVERAAEQLLQLGPGAVLIKGGGQVSWCGHDYLLERSGAGLWLGHSAVQTPHTHGSGCTLGAAITAQRALGRPLAQAVQGAKTYVEGGLRQSLAIGAGQGPLCHWHPWSETDG